MNFFTILCILGTIFYVWMAYDTIKNDRGQEGWLGFLFFLFIGLVAVILLITTMTQVIACMFLPTVEETYSFPIAALTDSKDLNGEIYLTRGHFETTVSYYYMRQYPDGTLKMGHIPADDTTIKLAETGASTQPEVTVIQHIHKDSFWLTWESKEYNTYRVTLPSTASLPNEFVIDMG